jgi:DNA-binding GntR family transcriptional regulator
VLQAQVHCPRASSGMSTDRVVSLSTSRSRPASKVPSVEQFVQNRLYGLMRELGVTIRVAKQMIGDRQASANESNLLGTKPGGPVLGVTPTSYGTNGKAIEVGHRSYRPELYSFELTLVEKQ